jgi:PAX-interacting protein 1
MARPSRTELLKGKIFYLIPTVRPSKKYLRDVIESAGGTVSKSRAKGSVLKEQNDNNKTNGVGGVQKETIVIACPDDMYLLKDVVRAGVGEHNSFFSSFISISRSICNAYRLVSAIRITFNSDKI